MHIFIMMWVYLEALFVHKLKYLIDLHLISLSKNNYLRVNLHYYEYAHINISEFR